MTTQALIPESDLRLARAHNDALLREITELKRRQDAALVQLRAIWKFQRPPVSRLQLVMAILEGKR